MVSDQTHRILSGAFRADCHLRNKSYGVKTMRIWMQVHTEMNLTFLVMCATPLEKSAGVIFLRTEKKSNVFFFFLELQSVGSVVVSRLYYKKKKSASSESPSFENHCLGYSRLIAFFFFLCQVEKAQLFPCVAGK